MDKWFAWLACIKTKSAWSTPFASAKPYQFQDFLTDVQQSLVVASNTKETTSHFESSEFRTHNCSFHTFAATAFVCHFKSKQRNKCTLFKLTSRYNCRFTKQDSVLSTTIATETDIKIKMQHHFCSLISNFKRQLNLQSWIWRSSLTVCCARDCRAPSWPTSYPTLYPVRLSPQILRRWQLHLLRRQPAAPSASISWPETLRSDQWGRRACDSRSPSYRCQSPANDNECK